MEKSNADFSKFEFKREERRPWKRAPPGTPEWFGIQDDDILALFLSQLPLRKSYAYARLSKQMKRVCTQRLEAELKVSPEQAAAFVDAMAGRSIFLTGGAGVGKSFTLRVIQKHLREGTYITTASTGCAAAHIGATTLHSALGIGIGIASASVYIHRIRTSQPIVYQRIREMKTLIIDEISMLDAAIFQKAGVVVSGVRANYTNDIMANAATIAGLVPWDGVQIIACGDFLQLPPVNVAKNLWPFESSAWRDLGFRNHVLSQVHRQTDAAFCGTLQRVRVGGATETDVRFLLSNASPTPVEGAIELFATNAPADEVNNRRFRELCVQGRRVHRFDAIDTGNPHKLEHCLAVSELLLCEGCRVMCLRNLGGGVFNGSLGTVLSIEPVIDGLGAYDIACVEVEFDASLSTDSVRYVFSTWDPDADPATVKREMTFSVTEGLANKVVASRIQLPLRLAYAISIHKSQGMSLDRASIDFAGCFENGQAYTALSRMRSLSGAHLRGLQLRHLRMAAKTPLAFYARLSRASGSDDNA